MLNNEPGLQLGVLHVGGQAPGEEQMGFLRDILCAEDSLFPLEVNTPLEARGLDAVIYVGACGSTPLAAELNRLSIPCLTMDPPLCFHPYHAAFQKAVAGGGILLPSRNRRDIAASLQALRARKRLAGNRLLVVLLQDEGFRADEVSAFADGCGRHLGVEILRRSVKELEERAGAHDDAAADRELARWYAGVMEEPRELDRAHMRQVAKLYLAERGMLEETGAAGITVEDMGGFLFAGKTMPNVSYGALAFDGYLACEEGDIEALASELLLLRGLGAAPTMSNIYLAYRDRFDALASPDDYTARQEEEDFRQCVAENRLTAAHFSGSGVLPPNMMEEARYRVRETLPSWPGQSMVIGTPKLGPVVLGRLNPDASGIHWVRGEADGLGLGDRHGWYRGRWYIRVPSVPDFMDRCLHQHYAIGPENERWQVLDILTEKLLGLRAL